MQRVNNLSRVTQQLSQNQSISRCLVSRLSMIVHLVSVAGLGFGHLKGFGQVFLRYYFIISNFILVLH